MAGSSPPGRRASGAAAADRLRDRIDRGGTGDKVAFLDPAAAPLGTDDEAAGHPPSAAQVAEAERHEAPRAQAAGQKQTVSGLQNGPPGRTRRILLACLALAALVLAAAAVWAIWLR